MRSSSGAAAARSKRPGSRPSGFGTRSRSALSSGTSKETTCAGCSPVLARELRAAHDAGLLHRDLSDGNILVERGPDGSFRLHFLDTNRVRSRRRLGGRARAKNLIRLGIPQDRRREFLSLYAGGGGPEPSFIRRYERSKAAFERWLRFKKKARLRQWARRLKLQ